jgi:crotonobetainyl-CoA:carnitine CoA-transferase CaiB-like acyl-CoA transferase
MHTPVPRLSATPADYRNPAPRIGEHTHDVLREMGFDEANIDALHAAGMIGAA